MEAKHTATPWRKELLGDGTVNVFGSDGYVCDMRSDDERAHADADLIVRACNAHDDLVKALEDAQSELQGILLTCSKADEEGAVTSAIKDIRAALAKATGA